jgi:hypothetical protein
MITKSFETYVSLGNCALSLGKLPFFVGNNPVPKEEFKLPWGATYTFFSPGKKEFKLPCGTT